MVNYGRAIAYGIVTTIPVLLFTFVATAVLAGTGREGQFWVGIGLTVSTLTVVFAGVEHLVDQRLDEAQAERESPGTNPLSGADQP